MENNKNTDLQKSQEEQQIEPDNLDIESGKEGEEQNGINYEGEYDGEIEGDEENQNQSEHEKEKEEIEPEGEQKEQIEHEIEKRKGDIIDGGDEQEVEVEARHDEGIEIAKEEIPQEVCDAQNEEINNDNKKKEENEKESFELKNNDKNINENKQNNLKKRIDILSKRLNLNKDKISKNKENENIEDKDNEIDKENNYIFLNLDKKNDKIFSELIGEIKDFKNKNQYNNKQFTYNSKFSNSNNNLKILNQELSKELKKLNNINYNPNNIYKTIEENKTSYLPKKYTGYIVRNQKFNEIFSIINERDFNANNKYNNINKTGLLSRMRNKMKYNNLSNINLLAPKRNSYLLNTLDNKISNNNNYRTLGNDSKKCYISCIDGKAFVNGMRKDILFTTKLNYNDNKLIKNNLFDDLNDKTNYYSTLKNVGKAKRRINSYFKKNVFDYERNNTLKSSNGKNDMKFKKIKNNFSKENLIKKLNEMNDNYFKKELKFLK